MANTRSLIEQAVLEAFGNPHAATNDPAFTKLSKIRAAMDRQLAEEDVLRDHRYRRSALDSCREVDRILLVQPDAPIAHGVEYDGRMGAWVDAKVFVSDADVDDIENE